MSRFCPPGDLEHVTVTQERRLLSAETLTLLRYCQDPGQKIPFVLLFVPGFIFLATSGQSGGPRSPITDVPRALNHKMQTLPALCGCDFIPTDIPLAHLPSLLLRLSVHVPSPFIDCSKYLIMAKHPL